MITKKEIIKTLKSFNYDSNKYGPSVYNSKDTLGICMDIKDSTFGYLTRVFTFNNKEELEEFLEQYTWYKNNYKKYNIKLTLEEYNTPITKL